MADKTIDEMTTDELKAEIARLNGEVAAKEERNVKVKNAMDKACSETASFKHQLADVKAELDAKRTDAEKAEAERIAREQEIQAELTALKLEKTIAGYKASYLALGYSEELATTAAEALANGDTNALFTAQKTYNETKKQEFEAAKINNMANLSTGSTPAADKAEEDKWRKAFGL